MLTIAYVLYGLVSYQIQRIQTAFKLLLDIDCGISYIQGGTLPSTNSEGFMMCLCYILGSFSMNCF